MKKSKASFKKSTQAQVAIIMGSKSDLPVMQKAADALKEFDVSFDIKIVSAHRTPEEMQDFALSAEENSYKLIIAGAGGAAHLPGMVASYTNLPVIGVPVDTTKLKGLDSILSILQMPQGVPVATVALDNAFNAGLLAVRILSLSTPGLSAKLAKHREALKLKIKKQNQELSKGKSKGK